ncbi:MAG: elongation factor 1-beta [Nanoarchaeota archaeon]|nr:elongation factor 1-beta [Nanoarchaeota archaeon]
MADVIVTFKIMPESLDVDLKKLEVDVKKVINRYGEVGKVETEEIAFGLKALKFIVIVDESKGGTEIVEDNLRNVEGVNSVEVTDVRRAIG